MAISEFWDAWPASPTSLFASEAMANQMGKLGKVTTFVNAQGLHLACYFWPATTAEPKAVVQLCHGNGAYLMEFLRTQVPSADGFSKQYGGFNVHALLFATMLVVRSQPCCARCAGHREAAPVPGLMDRTPEQRGHLGGGLRHAGLRVFRGASRFAQLL